MRYIPVYVSGLDGKDAQGQDESNSHSPVNQNFVELLPGSKKNVKIPKCGECRKMGPETRPYRPK